MFGYIAVNKPEMRFREFDIYQSYYCGLCKSLKERYGKRGQITLSYDMTFLALLLTSLYEPETVQGVRRCAVHPIEKHRYSQNQFTDYAADMNLLLSYEKCLDDWNDEHSIKKGLLSLLLKNKDHQIQTLYPEKFDSICHQMAVIHQHEKADSSEIDEVAGAFGQIMAEIFAYRKDEWEETLRRMGFFLGKFIYLMDAYEDIDKDEKKDSYNPLRKLRKDNEKDFETLTRLMMTSMMSECAKSFERLPILLHADILRNILYSGVWTKYEYIQLKKKKRTK